jgi:hypothetical protein
VVDEVAEDKDMAKTQNFKGLQFISLTKIVKNSIIVCVKIDIEKSTYIFIDYLIKSDEP